MAFFAQTGPNERARLSQQLGQALGGGFGKAIGENIANKKQLQQQAGLAQLLFGNQAQNNPEAAQMMQKFSQLSPEVQLEAYKAMQPKAPAGGATGQPIPPEEARAIKEVLEENPNADAETLGIKFTERNVRPVISSPYIESRRRSQESKEKQEQSKFKSDRDYNTQRSLPFMKKIDESRESIARKDQALYSMENAIVEGNLGLFSTDTLANFAPTGIAESLRSAKGAQLITAQKEFLLGNLSRGGARPNMYLEQQIVSQLPKQGRTREANLTVVEALRAEQEYEKKRIEIADEMSSKYEKELGYIPGDIGSQVDKAMKPYAENIQNKLAYKLRDLQETEIGQKGLMKMKNQRVTQGTPLTLNMAKIFLDETGSKEAAIKKAQSLGYRIPTVEEYRMYHQ